MKLYKAFPILLCTGLLLIVILSACGSKSSGASDLAPLVVENPLATTGTFETNDCPPPRFRGMNIKQECGNLMVPEDRADPQSETIKLPVIILRTANPTPKPDPVVFLAYGPSDTTSFGAYFAFGFADLFKERDFIIIDQRGVGESQPAFNCPALTEAYAKGMAFRPYGEDMTDALLSARQACFDDWLQQDVKFERYTSDAIAADLIDLRLALEIEKWNIFSTAYGGQVALLLMEKDAASTRSVLIDSITALKAEDYGLMGAQMQQNLDGFFASCADDAQCSEAYPDFEAVFYETVDQLNAAPTLLEVDDTNQGKRYTVLLDGDRLLDLAFTAVMSPSSPAAGELPRMVYQIRQDVFTSVSQMLVNSLRNTTPATYAANDLALCKEMLGSSPPERLTQGLSAVKPQVGTYFQKQTAMMLSQCAVWKDIQISPSITNVNPSGIPVLFTDGALTTYSPVEWSRQLATQFSNSQLVVFAGRGGMVWFDRYGSDCPRQIVSEFIANPQDEVDASCAAQTPKPVWITLP